MQSSSDLRAYHGDPDIKAGILAQLAGHRAADQLVQGYGYWKDGKGCAVGCALHQSDGPLHRQYETRFGIPQVLARLEDRLFEGLSVSLARQWPEQFMGAICPGADLTLVWPRFALWLLTEEVAPHAAARAKCAAAVADVAALYRELVETGKSPERTLWSAAAASAYASAYAAAAAAAASAAAAAAAASASAAYAAASDASAAASDAASDASDAASDASAAASAASDAAYAAASDASDAASDASAAASAASDAAYAAASADGAARQACFARQADKLVELLAAAPVAAQAA